MRFLVISLALLFLMLSSAPGASLEELKAAFDTRCDFAKIDRDLQIKKLDTSYLTALDREMQKAQATGKLDSVIPFRNESLAVKNADNPMPALSANATPKLKGMRSKYQEARDKILKSHAETLVDLVGKMENELKSQEADLTKAGKLDEAFAAKQLRESLAKDQEILAARERLAKPKSTLEPEAKYLLLTEQDFKITQSSYYTGPLVGKPGEGKKFDSYIEFFKSQHRKENEIFAMGSPARVEFKLPRKVTVFEGTAIMGPSPGDVTFKVSVNGKVVYENRLAGPNTKPEKVHCEFAPGSNLVLEIDPNGSQLHDCVAWIRPIAR